MSLIPETSAFGSATVILPVVNETYSLVQTVDSILETSKANVRELLNILGQRIAVLGALGQAGEDQGRRSGITPEPGKTRGFAGLAFVGALRAGHGWHPISVHDLSATG